MLTSESNKALELLGRHLGMFKDDKPTVGVHVNLTTDQASFREKMAAKRKQRSGKLLQPVPSTD